MPSNELTAFWFRRDLRIDDNTGLHHALRSGLPVQCFFIFDQHILRRLEDNPDRRVLFIHRRLNELNALLKEFGATLITGYGTPLDCWKKWMEKFSIRQLFTNRDYEPYARERDALVESFCHS